MTWKPEPVLPEAKGIATICGVDGRLSVGIDAEGQVRVVFASEQRVTQAWDWMNTSEQVAITGLLDDGRTIALHDCLPTSNAVVQEQGRPDIFELGFSPARLIIDSSDRVPTKTEFGLVNLWFTLRAQMRFDGFDIELHPANRAPAAHISLDKGKPAWLTHWVAVLTRDWDAVEAADEVVNCFARTLSLLTMERIVVPVRRVSDDHGDTVRWEFRLTPWPLHRGLDAPFVWDTVAPLRVVGKGEVRRRFSELGLSAYIGYLLESRRRDVLYAEQNLACVLLALELLGAKWLLAEGCAQEEVAKMSIVTKLAHINSSLRFIPKKYTSEWLYHGLRNPLIHTGVIPLLDPVEIAKATEELLALAVDIFLRIFGFDRSAPPT